MFNFRHHLIRQRAFSEKTFGPGLRVTALLDHINKELVEIHEKPLDLEEWIDVVILALDGAWRSGHTPDEIIAGLVGKQKKNEGRNWPDWRRSDPNKATEHIRSADEPPKDLASTFFDASLLGMLPTPTAAYKPLDSATMEFLTVVDGAGVRIEEIHPYVQVPPYTRCDMCGARDIADGEWTDGSERTCTSCGKLGEMSSETFFTGHTYWILFAIEADDVDNPSLDGLATFVPSPNRPPSTLATEILPKTKDQAAGKSLREAIEGLSEVITVWIEAACAWRNEAEEAVCPDCGHGSFEFAFAKGKEVSARKLTDKHKAILALITKQEDQT